MTRTKYYFREPIIRARIGRVRFPSVCPVCGKPATSVCKISTAPNRQFWLRPAWDPTLRGPKKYGLPTQDTKTFLIEVCDDHNIADFAEGRFRSLSTIFASLMIGSIIFALMFAGAEFSATRHIAGWVPLYVGILAVSLILGYWSFRPNALETAIKIVGFDFDVQHVWLSIRNEDYRQKLLNENGMHAELVSWVIKA